MKVLVDDPNNDGHVDIDKLDAKKADELESVFIRFDMETIGLAYDQDFEAEWEGHGMEGGVTRTVELTVPRYIARQLKDALEQEEL